MRCNHSVLVHGIVLGGSKYLNPSHTQKFSLTNLYSLAYAEMRLILARILYRFEVELAPEAGDWFNQKVFVVWDKPALPFYLKPASSQA